MKRNSILICILFAIAANLIAPAAKAQVDVNDSLALMDLYNSTSGPQWTNHTNWLTTQPVSSWFGITVTGSHVTRVLLSSNHLNGVIPASIGNLAFVSILNLSFNQLSGTIPPSIGNLTNLTGLVLFSNYLTGTIPAEIGNLSFLTNLQLDVNQLSGPIPAEIGNLTNLTYIDLEINGLSGTLPATLGNLTNLSYLGLNQNQFTGALPATLANLTNLITLYLSGNQFTGAIPATLGNLTKLTNLQLGGNQFTGTIPNELGNLTKLITLNLGSNQLSGAVPASFHKLTKLNFFDISYNQLSSFGYTNAALNINAKVRSYVQYNFFTFDALQFIASNYHNATYAPQDTILPIHQMGNTLSVSAGGTLSKNTYIWYKAGSTNSTTIKGDSTFSPLQSGMYYVKVTNAVATRLTLYSDTVSYTTPLVAQTNNSIANIADVKTSNTHFSIYPNPASNSIHVQVNGNAIVTLTNAAGKTLLTKTINNSDAINVSAFANGTYYIQNKTTGEVQKVIITH